jgi:hypothetical protein
MAKFTVTFKDPDYSIDATASVVGVPGILEKFLEWDEYVTIEFDTETGKARVCLAEERA